jgi:hypothetical protein
MISLYRPVASTAATDVDATLWLIVPLLLNGLRGAKPLAAKARGS